MASHTCLTTSKVELDVNILFEEFQRVADKHGSIGPRDLWSVVGMNAKVLAELEYHMYERDAGPGPWHLHDVEELLRKMLLSATRVEASEPTCSQNSTVDANGQLCSLITDLQDLNELVENAVRAEPESFMAKLEDAKSEHSLGAEGMEARLAKLQDFVMLHVVIPCLHKDASSEAKVNACVMLRSLFDGVFALLNKTWHLAQARARRVLYFTGGLNAGADVAQLPTAARIGLDGSEKADLRKMKTALKEKTWELVRAQKKVEQLERSLNVEHVLLNMERARQRETWSRCETERSLQEAALVSCQQQLNDLRQQQGKTSHRDRGDQSSSGRKYQSALGVLREEEDAGSEARARKVGSQRRQRSRDQPISMGQQIRPQRAKEEDECSVGSSCSRQGLQRSPRTSDQVPALGLPSRAQSHREEDNVSVASSSSRVSSQLRPRSSDQGPSLAAQARSHTPRDRSADRPQYGVASRSKVQTPPAGAQPAPKSRAQLGSQSVPVPRGKTQPSVVVPPKGSRTAETAQSASQAEAAAEGPLSARGMPRKSAKTPVAASPKLMPAQENSLIQRCCKEPTKLARSQSMDRGSLRSSITRQAGGTSKAGGA